MQSEGQRADPPWEQEQDLGAELRKHLAILRSGVWWIAASLTLVLGVAVVWLNFTPKVFRSSSSILVESSGPRVLGDQTDSVSFDQRAQNDPLPTKEYLETQYRVITSRQVLGRVVKELQLDRDLEFLGLSKIRDPDALQMKREKVSALHVLRKRVKVAPVRDSQLIEIMVDDTSPTRAARIADAVVAAYLQSNLDRRLESTRTARTWLADQIDDLKEKLESSDLALFSFRQEHDLLATSTGERLDLVGIRLNALTESLASATARRVELGASVAEVGLAKLESPNDVLWPMNLRRISEDPALLDLRHEIARVEGDTILTAERYLEKHPQRIAAEARYDRLRLRIDRAMGHVLAGLRGEYREAIAVESQLKQLLEEGKREAFELSRKEIEQRKLQRDQDNNQRLYDLVLARLKDADLAMLLQSNNIHILDSAETPTLPVFPRTATVLTLALILGTSLGVALAYLRGLLRTTSEG